ncbi:MAG: SAM-dependent methyltransferase, partial [Succinivibrio sp.]|nr:SAM-dependent methyltransferase [Succinivibrio sp.]
MSDFYTKDDLSALEAINLAQKIAAGPMLFQTVCILLTKGVLKALDEAKTKGMTKAELAKKCAISDYGISVLLDMALSGRVVYHQGERFFLGKVGHFILNDRMTRLNFEFTNDVCYKALAYLDEAIEQGKPCGLKVFNESWQTIYPHLSELPPKAQQSWFAWDHFYSDVSFKAALKVLSELGISKLNDVGGNTGKFAIRCCETLPDI